MGSIPKGFIAKDAKDAASWLMIAYSLGHPEDCDCRPCFEARVAIARTLPQPLVEQRSAG
jgi:hypothetical protein